MDNLLNFQTILSLCLGIGLAAASGFKVFIPLFVISFAAFFGNDYIDLGASWKWIGTLPAVITFGVAMLVEAIAYFIPFVDNLLDTVSVFLAATVGTLMVVMNLPEMEGLTPWVLAIIAGGGTAGLISTKTAGIRAASSATTAGTGNFVVNTGETFMASILSALSVI